MRNNQVILLVITDGEKWHYLAVRSSSTLLRRITSNHNGDFYCLKCLHSYRTKNKLEKHDKLCDKHDYCYIKMPKQYNKTLITENYGEKSLKAPFAIYLGNKVLLPKIYSSQNNPQESYADKKVKHIPSGCAWSLTCSFDSTKNKHGYYRGKDCLESPCEKFALEIINYEENEMIPLTDKENKSYKKKMTSK